MYQIPKLYPKKLAKRRRKLRSLVPKETVADAHKSRCSVQLSIFLALLSSVIIGIYYSNVDTDLVLSNFLTSYRNQYNLILHGEKNYCSPALDTSKLFAQIRNDVINQLDPLSEIEREFRNDTEFTAIAIVGTSGVGKSLFVQTVKDNFPWQENTQVYAWSTFYTENQKKDVLMFLNYLSECGRNLIIIDSLRVNDMDFVQEYTKISQTFAQRAKANLILVYVFNVISYSDEQREQYDDAVQSLQQLEDVKTVKFKKFDSKDLEECIRNEAKNLNIFLDDDDFDEVFNSIDVEHSGCKNVQSKVVMFGEV